MFCSNCGEKLEERASFCSNCGERVAAQPRPTMQPQPAMQPQPMMPSQQTASQNMGGAAAFAQGNTTEEFTLKSGACNWARTPIVVQNGKGVLTNKRFIYKKGFIGTLDSTIYNAVTGNKADFEIPLSEFAGIREGRQGLVKTLVLQTKSGKEYNCFFHDRESWIIEFKRALEGF